MAANIQILTASSALVKTMTPEVIQGAFSMHELLTVNTCICFITPQQTIIIVRTNVSEESDTIA